MKTFFKDLIFFCRQRNIRKCSSCWFQRFYLTVALFFISVVPTILLSSYIYRLTWTELRKEIRGRSGKTHERKDMLAKAFGIISIAFSVCYTPYVISAAVNVYFSSVHSSVFADKEANRQYIFWTFPFAKLFLIFFFKFIVTKSTIRENLFL